MNRRLIRSLAIFCFLILALALLVSSCEASVVDIARSEIGHEEIDGNNQGIYVKQYLQGKEGLPWCAGFVSYCLKQAGYNLPYLLRAKSFLKYGKAVSDPQAGDLIVFSRKGGGHVGIIEEVTADTITTIEGNRGKYPAKVKRFTYNRNAIKNLLGYVKLEEIK